MALSSPDDSTPPDDADGTGTDGPRPVDGSAAPDPPFVVVGLGASAGGLDALEAFFGGLPSTDSCAFVVVIHLAPDREAEMAEILGRVVPVPVVQVSARVRVEPGRVYVIPPNRTLVIEDGHLRLEPVESERRLRRPIDSFFRTLAGAYGDHAVAVVLSGTGQNGTVGVRAVKEAGGLILAQAPDEAQHSEMPRAAIASGAVDTVATAGALAREAVAYAERLRRVRLPTGTPGALPPDDVQTVQTVLSHLQAQNEELQSVNEELRSTAEELEAAKEEARSMAEELLTVNDEMKATVAELGRATSDLENVIVSTQIATLFLDRQLTIKWFTPQVRALFHLRPTDVGRPLADLVQSFGDARLVDDARTVLEQLRVTEREVESEDGRWFLVHGRPYRSLSDHIDGVVVTFVDITERRRSEAGMRESEERYRTLFTTIGEGFFLCEVVRDESGRVVDYRYLEANPAFGTLTGLSPEAVTGKTVREAIPGVETLWIDRVGAVADAGEPAFFEDYAAPLDRWIAARAYPQGSDRVAVFFSNVTERRRDERALRASAERAAFRVALTDALRPLADAGEVRAAAVRLLGEHLGAARAFYGEPDGEPDGDVLRIDQRYVAGSLGESAVGRYVLTDFGPDVVADYRAGRTRVVADARDDARLSDDARAAYAAAGIGALIAVPLVRDGQFVGLLGVNHPEPRAWTPDEVALVRETAERTWAAAERARAETALRESEEQRRLAMAAAQMGTYTWTAAADTVEADVRVCEIFGFAPDDCPMSRADFHAYIHPDDLGLLADVRDAMVGETEHGVGGAAVTFRVVRPTGDVRHVEVHSQTFTDGDAVVSVGLVADVTERAEAEAALRASETRYRTLFTRMDEGFCVLEVLFDDDGTAVDWLFVETNPAFESQTGLEDAAGRTMRSIIPDHDDHWFETYGRVVRTGEPVRFVDESKTMDRWFDLYAFPVGVPGSHRVAVLFNDITAQKRTERDITTLNATLEERVAERTLQVQTLAARLTVAEQAERQRIAHVLHDDLQQQLYGLSLVLSLLPRARDGAAVGEIAGRATTILDGAVHLARTLSTTLSPPILQAERLADILEWVADEQRRIHGLAVDVEVRDDLQVADPALRILLYQGLREVLFNVVKHSGGTTARLSAWADRADDVAVVVVRVEDDGAGFDVAARAGRPAGFGLVGVRERLVLVGGRFEIDSAPGRGTRVSLSVPSAVPVPDSP